MHIPHVPNSWSYWEFFGIIYNLINPFSPHFSPHEFWTNQYEVSGFVSSVILKPTAKTPWLRLVEHLLNIPLE